MRDVLEAARAEARRRLPMFAMRVAAPCDAKWDDMQGDDKTRLCSACEKNVHDLRAMTSEEIATFLAEGGEACVQIYQRADEKVMRENCPVGLRRARHRSVAFSGLSVAAAALGCFTALATLGATASAAMPNEVPESAVKLANVMKAEPGILNVIGPSSMVFSVDGAAMGNGVVGVALASFVTHVVTGVDPTTGAQHTECATVAPGQTKTIHVAPVRIHRLGGKPTRVNPNEI